jgi:hypothetical protein
MGLIVIMNMGNVQAWTAQKDKLMTIWSWDTIANKSIIDTNNVWQEYPRPQMKRPVTTWKNLNGIWQYQKQTALLTAAPVTLNSSILIPFPLEAANSGVMEHTGIEWAAYKKTFQLPAGWDITKYKILLHFGASDFQTRVWINGTLAGPDNIGGYNSFDFDITGKLINNGTGNQVLGVSVYDPNDGPDGIINPFGKQSQYPAGNYQSTTGIWQTVWLEAVPATTYINSLKITPSVDSQLVHVTVNLIGDVANAKVYGFARQGTGTSIWGGDSATAAAATNLTIHLSANNLWWPNRPFLYDLGIYVKSNGGFVDSVQSYFGQRKIAAVKVGNYTKPYLNGIAQFLYGPLDQGFWPDGEYTAPSYTALKYDIQKTKDFGFNCCRKHVKIEPQLWYFACDSMGLLVLQDMPSMWPVNMTANNTADINFKFGLSSMVQQNYNHPCIVTWITYNESWGEPSQAIVTTNVNLVYSLDPTRLVNVASGWGWYPLGNYHDNHDYSDPLYLPDLPIDPNYICGNGECGGLLVKISGHEWIPANAHGYGSNLTPANAVTALTRSANSVLTAKNTLGCETAIYTEICDQETEENGLLTYDRLNKYTASQESSIKTLVQQSLDPSTPAAIVNPAATIPSSFFVTTGVIDRINSSAMRIQKVRVTRRTLTISLSDNDPKAVGGIRIFNARGQNVFSSVVTGINLVTVPTAQMGTGIYIVELNNGITRQRVSCVVK